MATAPGWFDVSTDAFQPYESAIDAGLYDRANHAQVVKLFSTRLDRISESYSPAKFVSVAKDAVTNNPDLDRAGTSHVEQKRNTSPVVQAAQSIDLCVFEVVGQLASCARAPLLALQFCKGAFGPEDYTSDGSGNHRSCIGHF